MQNRLIGMGFGLMSPAELAYGILTYQVYYTEHLWFLYVLFVIFVINMIFSVY